MLTTGELIRITLPELFDFDNTGNTADSLFAFFLGKATMLEPDFSVLDKLAFFVDCDAFGFVSFNDGIALCFAFCNFGSYFVFLVAFFKV